MNALANTYPRTDIVSVQAHWLKTWEIRDNLLFFPNILWDWERRIWVIDRRLKKSRIWGRRKTDISEIKETLPKDILAILEKYPWSEFKPGHPNNQCIEIRPTPTCPWVYRLYWTIEEIRWSIKYVLEGIEKHYNK